MRQLDKPLVQIQEALDISFDNDPTSNGAGGYDDVQGNINSATVGAAAPGAVNYDFGIVGGESFRCVSFDTNDTATLVIQTQHRIKLDEPMDLHFHWTADGGGSIGQEFQFQFDVIAAGVHGEFAAVGDGTYYSGDIEVLADAEKKHNYADVANLPAANTTVSTIYLIKVTRISPDDGTDYSGNIIMLYIDGHMTNDQNRGSREEAVK